MAIAEGWVEEQEVVVIAVTAADSGHYKGEGPRQVKMKIPPKLMALVTGSWILLTATWICGIESVAPGICATWVAAWGVAQYFTVLSHVI